MSTLAHAIVALLLWPGRALARLRRRRHERRVGPAEARDERIGREAAADPRPGAPGAPAEDDETIAYDPRSSPGAEILVAALLLLAAAGFVGFLVLIVVAPQTQLLALLLGGGLAAVAAALVIAGARIVPRETTTERRPMGPHPGEQTALVAQVREGGSHVSRRRLLTGAAGTAGVALGAAAVGVPATAIGPGPRVLDRSPWRAGIPLIGEDDAPVSARTLEVGSFVTAFPRGADKRELGSPVVVLRLPPEEIVPARGREDWSPLGLMAFSKICTHAGCAVSLFRYPVSEELSSGPALVCPCHYSTFDVRHAARVIFGPAGRPLPQLPLRIAADDRLIAGGPLSGSVGPAWWGTERSA